MSDAFTDARGRKWVLSITYGDVRRVKKLLGLNLASLADRQVTEEELTKLSVDQLPVFMRLQADPLTMVDVLFSLLQPQADEQGVSDEDFGSSLTPEVFRQATEIFWRLYHDFFLKSGESMKAKMIEGLMRYSGAVEEKTEAMDAKINEMISNAELI